jgi:hypothetical protein
VHNVPQGKYVVRVRPTFGGYVQSIRSGTHDLLREELVVPEDAQVSTIEITLRDDGGSLQVRVHTDTPNHDVMVVTLPLFGVAPEPQMMGVSAGLDHFQTAALAPGSYKLFAFDASIGVSNGNLEPLDKYAAQGTTVTVSANSKSEVMLDVIKGDVQ